MPRPISLPKPPKPVPISNGLDRAQADDLRLVQEQIKRACAVLNDDRMNWCPACERSGLEPHHRAQLLKALDALLDRKGVLLGIHKPGPSKAPSVSRRPVAGPSYDPTPAPIATMGGIEKPLSDTTSEQPPSIPIV